MARVGQAWRLGALAAGFALALVALMCVELGAKARPFRPARLAQAETQSDEIERAPSPLAHEHSLALPSSDWPAARATDAAGVAPAPSSPPSLEPLPPLASSSLSPSPPEPAPQLPTQKIVLSRPRRVASADLAAWSRPGLCTSAPDAAAARETVLSSFRLWDADQRGKLYLDPRLPAGVELPILGYLDQAAEATSQQLGVQTPRPTVFVYFDQRLMKAAACINEDAVAFYDGALHIVASRSDLLQSVLHEYTHHVLFSSGLVGPAWAQEGIAMHIAGETWWRDPQLLLALQANPFAQDDMDRSIPYKLSPPQAVAFYVQSAALVECLMRERSWSLRQLFENLHAGDLAGSTTYDLPELAQSSFLHDCLAR